MRSATGLHALLLAAVSAMPAAAANVVARRTGYPDPEEAFIAGLLHDLGQLLLVLAVPEEYKQVVALGPGNMTENEQKIIGSTHNRAGQQLLKHWKLPKNLCDAVRFHHTPKVFTGEDDPLVSIVALADTLSCAHGLRYERAIEEAEFRRLIERTGLDVEHVGEMLADRQAEHDMLAGSALRWTMLRPPRLTDAPGQGGYRLTHETPAGTSIARRDLAQAAVDVLSDAGTWGRAPFVAGGRA